MTESRRRSGWFDGVALSVFAIGVLVVALVFAMQRSRRLAFQRAQETATIGVSVRFDLTDAHIALDAWAAGDAGIEPARDVTGRYDHAAQLIAQLGDVLANGRGGPVLRDSLLLDRVAALQRQVSSLRDMAITRVGSGRTGRGAADSLDVLLSSGYGDALRESRAIGETFDGMLAEVLATTDRAEYLVDLLLALGAVVLATILARQRRRDRAAYVSLATTVNTTTNDLRSREARTRALLNSSIDAIITTDDQGTITGCNPAAERLFGWTEEELLTTGVRPLMGEPYRSMEPKKLGVYFDRARASERGVSEIVLGRHRDGRDIVIDMSLSLVQTGERNEFMTIMRDIGERVAAEQRFQVIFEHATAAHLLLRAEAIGDCNLAAVALFAAADKAALMVHALSSLLPEHQPDGQPSMALVETLLRRDVAEGAYKGELHFRKLNGEYFPAEVTLTPAEFEGSPITLLEVRDLSERRRSETALVLAKETAEAAARAKSQFLATVSHEIRTPMNGILGMTGLLIETSLDDKQRQYAQAVKSSADSLLAIINDILDFSKIEAGKLTIEPLPFDLVGTLEEVCDLMAPRADEKGIALAMHVGRAMPTQFVGDAGRIRQMALNLLANAVKFTSFGHVVLELDVIERHADVAVVRLSVHDTGIGIPEAQQARIFEDFSQGDATMSRRFGGTGLGLAITRRLAEMMGGSAGFRSVDGRGSTFWTTVRLSIPRDSRVASPMPDLADRRVLVVDAHDVTRRALAQRLESFGTQVDTRALGDHGLQQLRQAASLERPYDVVFVEFGTRTNDDLEFAEAVRAEPTTGATPLVMLARTSDAVSEEQAQAMGYVDVITKPARGSALLGAMRRAREVREQRAGGPVGEPAGEPAGRPAGGVARQAARRKQATARPAAEVL